MRVASSHGDLHTIYPIERVSQIVFPRAHLYRNFFTSNAPLPFSRIILSSVSGSVGH